MLPVNANGVESPSPGLPEERGQPWVCNTHTSQPQRGCDLFSLHVSTALPET